MCSKVLFIYTHIFVYIFVNTLCTYMYTYLHIYILMHICLHIYIYIFNTHVFICIYKNMYTHVYIYDIRWNDDIWIFSTMNFHERWWFDHTTWWSFIIVYRIHPISTIMMRCYLKLFRGFQSHGGTPPCIIQVMDDHDIVSTPMVTLGQDQGMDGSPAHPARFL